jgi:hypothetical protein
MVNDLYEVVEEEFKGVDAIYEDAIIRLIGTFGLNMLRMHKLIESCGVVHGRQLYVLCNKNNR